MAAPSTQNLRLWLATLALSAGCNGARSTTAAEVPAPPDAQSAGADVAAAPDGAAVVDAPAFLDRAGEGGSAGASCSYEKPCAAPLFCELPRPQDQGCGRQFLSGICQARPTDCPAAGPPVCGCDGKTYASDCVRQQAGAPLAGAGACQGWETGPITCGSATCRPDQVCVVPSSSCGAAPPCMPAPDGGACPPGLVTCQRPGSATPGCTYSCAPPPPYCLDVPASCRALPTCACLQPPGCHCEGIRQGRRLYCGGAA